MAYSEVKIANLALFRIGASQTIISFDEGSQEADAAALIYDEMRDEVLRRYPWDFARRSVTLALVEENPNVEWQYSYRYPNDCLFARYISSASVDNRTDPVPYQLAGDSQGRLIWTDQEQAVLQYTARIEDPVLFDPMFASALSWRMAMEFARVIARNPMAIRDATIMYNQAIDEAEAMEANESQKEPEPDAEHIRVRG